MKQIFMDKAFECAKKAYDENEVPIGAVIVKDNEIISHGYNQKEKNKSIFEHAEIIAIIEAERKLSNWRLENCEMYVTLDPCPMCASAIKQSRIKNVYSALENTDRKNCEIIKKIFEGDNTNPEVSLNTNLAVDKSKKLLNSFFEKQRNN